MDWTLCYKKSPKENSQVLLTFKNSSGLHVSEALFKDDGYYAVSETPHGYFEELFGIPVAWMEMPEPYQD